MPDTFFSSAKQSLLRASDRLPPGLRRQLYRGAMALSRDESFPSIYSSLKYLRTWGFRPLRVVDVGAYHGEWTIMMKSVYPQARVLMVEPQQDKQALLERACARFGAEVALEVALLGATEGETVEFVEMETGSSVFEEMSEHHPRERVQKCLTTLDALVAQATDWDGIDFLKLDVQGYELEILRGASSFLPRSEFVLMETSVVPRNVGCPTIDNVFAFMTAHGFRLLDFCSQHRRPTKALGQTDLLFLNARSSVIPTLFHDAASWNARHSIDETLDGATWT